VDWPRFQTVTRSTASRHGHFEDRRRNKMQRTYTVLPSIYRIRNSDGRSRTLRLRVHFLSCFAPTVMNISSPSNRRPILSSAILLSSALNHTITKIPWPQSASEIYRPSDRPLSAKLVSIFADRGCQVVSVTDPCGSILGF
jgi:hypothetical protein